MMTNIARTPNTGSPKFQADPLNSTYRWELYLTPGRAGNRVGVMDGYSKGMGFENTNKVELLYKKLMNPILPYLYKCDTIVLFEQKSGLPKHLHTPLLELYPNHYISYNWVKDDKEVGTVITDYLDLYYKEYVKTGQMPPVEDRRKNVRQSVYMSELDHTRHQFKNQQELKDFCLAKSSKYSKTCMLGWYYRHAEFQPELFESDLTAEYNHAHNTAPSYEAAQAAQAGKAAMNAMLNQSNFKSNR